MKTAFVSRRSFLRNSACLSSGVIAAAAAKPALLWAGENTEKLAIGGIMPSLSVQADLLPARSESGIGALMPWANRLWFVTYVSHKSGSGSGTGLFYVDELMALHKHTESVVGTYANRMIHSPSNQLIIGPHLVDAAGQVRTIKSIQEHRLTATMEHLDDPKNKVYFLTMEGLLIEVDLNNLGAKQLFDLNRELDLPKGAQPHFKGGHTGSGRVVVANNTYDERDHAGTWTGGCLAEWNGQKWAMIEKTAFNEVTGRKNWGQVIFATGWDKASAILKVFADGKWSTYRLPKASHAFDHFWQTEWPRIREVETERYLMDCHGMFYEMSPVAYEGKIWGLRPVSTHLRIIPDFCSWRGFLVLGGNQVTPNRDTNLLAGQPQAGLWFGKTDDLWQFGKPKGWGGLWWEKPIAANQPSDPFLMTGFDKKVLHLCHLASQSVEFKIEVDFLGNQTWKEYAMIQVQPNGYKHHEFPSGFSAHWVRVTASADCTATAYFIYS